MRCLSLRSNAIKELYFTSVFSTSFGKKLKLSRILIRCLSLRSNAIEDLYSISVFSTSLVQKYLRGSRASDGGQRPPARLRSRDGQANCSRIRRSSNP